VTDNGKMPRQFRKCWSVRNLEQWVWDGLSEAKPINASNDVMGIAEFIIGRAFARPVGSTHPTGLWL